jgi:hypothetical protein
MGTKLTVNKRKARDFQRIQNEKKQPISIGAEKKCRKSNFAAFFKSVYLPG